jgi:TatD DNase family protein
MIQYIDTHSHIYLPEFSNDLDECVHRAVNSGVEKIVLPNIDSKTIEPLDGLLSKFPKHCFGLMGLHPTHVKDNYKQELDTIFNALESGKYIGVGEIGIDLYWDKTHIKEQIDALIQQINYAYTKQLPFIIHVRDSFDEIFDTLYKIGKSNYRGIFHAFTGTIEQAKKAADLGLLIGIGGIVTFKNSGLANVVKELDLNQLVLETDSPYLAPTPHRGKRNESSYIPLIASKIAEIKGIRVEEVARITTNNAESLFRI